MWCVGRRSFFSRGKILTALFIKPCKFGSISNPHAHTHAPTPISNPNLVTVIPISFLVPFPFTHIIAHCYKNEELHHKLQQTKHGQWAVSEVVTVLKM
jgi:hypothetical protein